MDIKKIAKALGSRGGKATLKSNGREHFVRMGKISAEKRKKNEKTTV